MFFAKVNENLSEEHSPRSSERKKIRKSILFRKYFAMLFVLIFLSSCATGLAVILSATRQEKKQRLQNLYSSAKEISDLAGDLLSLTGGGDFVADYENALIMVCYTIKNFSENTDTDIFMTNSEGKVVICKEMLDLNNQAMEGNVCTIHQSVHFSKEVLDRILAGENSYMGKISKKDKTKTGIAASPIYLNTPEKTLTGFIFVTKEDIGAFGENMFPVHTQFLVSLLLAAVLSTIFVKLIMYRFAWPLYEILTATNHYSSGDFSYRITEQPGSDEMASLTRAFNSMANDLSALEDSRRSFVANVSHELKTPMTTIGGFIDGILDGTIPPSEEKRYLSIVSDEVKRLSRLISSMLNMAKIEAGELTPQFSDCNLSQMLVKIFLSFERVLSQNEVTVTGLDTEEDVHVAADPDMINQVLYNIIDNAVKFTPKGMEIAVSCKTERGRAIVKVRNYGIDISEEDLTKIFERFYKVDKSRSLNTKSVGLGLYICKNIIELHNGKIYANAKENTYAEFTIELPVNQPGAPVRHS